MLRPTSFDRPCCIIAIITCHARLCLTVCVVKQIWLHAIIDVVRLRVLSKGYDRLPYPTLSDWRWWPRAKMSRYRRCCLTAHIVKRIWWHAMPDDVFMCVQFKGDDSIPRPSLSDCVSCPRTMMTCHAWSRPNMCVVEGIWWHATPDIVRPCLF